MRAPDWLTARPVAHRGLHDPARGIISYPAALAQTLLKKKVGDTVEAAGESTPQKLRIDRVEKVPAEIVQAL